jgi:hypothetical protein
MAYYKVRLELPGLMNLSEKPKTYLHPKNKTEKERLIAEPASSERLYEI